MSQPGGRYEYSQQRKRGLQDQEVRDGGRRTGEGASIPRRLRLLLCPCPSGVGRNLCAKLLCACDQSAAGCMASAFYNHSLQSAGRRECRGDRPTCEGGGPAAAAPGSSSEEDSEEAPPLTRRFLGKPLGLAGPRPPYGPR